jgi:hypothetical protein
MSNMPDFGIWFVDSMMVKNPINEKLLKMLHHGVKHTEDHALNYRNWAKKSKTNGQEEAGALHILLPV